MKLRQRGRLLFTSPSFQLGPEFSIENALPKRPTVTIFAIDLSQLLKGDARVIH
ncbi:hypothetical protein ACWOHQ_002080 [Vibrio parahaemolyticus]